MIKFLIICLILSSNLLAQELSYENLEKNSIQYDRKILNLSGIVREAKLHKSTNDSFWELKISQSSETPKYIKTIVYKSFKDEVLDEREFVSGEIFDFEGEFRSNIEIAASKKIGDLYVNKKAHSQSRVDYINEIKSNGYVSRVNAKKASLVSLSDMSIDFIESTDQIIQNQGIIDQIKYQTDQSGNEYWEITLRDFEVKEGRKMSSIRSVLRYHQVIQGKRYSDMPLDEILRVGQKLNITGQYQYVDKMDYGPVGIINLNFVNEDGKYFDYFINKGNDLKKINKGKITNANNDQKIQDSRIEVQQIN